MCYEEYLRQIIDAQTGCILLEGESGSGKTQLLKLLKQRSPRTVLLFSYQDIIDEIIKTNCNCEWYLRDINAENCIVCIEDVDFLSQKEATQEYLAKMICFAAEKHLVVLTGIDVRGRASKLCAECMPEIIEINPSCVMRYGYCFSGSRAIDSAKYFDIVMSHGYKGDMDYLAWDAAHKFGMRMTAPGIASFRDGITIGDNALIAAGFLDDEYRAAYESCEEYGRKAKMRELMAIAYAKAEKLYDIEIKLM